MSEILKDFDAMKVLLWVIPGAFIVLFRSFAIRGSFPTIGKDDVAAFVLGSVIYDFLVVFFASGFQLQAPTASGLWLLVLIVLPALVGLLLGFVEASDAVGRLLRKIGLRLPSPDATAWETMFREMPANAVLLVTLTDGATIAGRWIGGKGGSASSTDPKIMDLYLGEIGTINNHGHYVPKVPQRGAYFTASQIRAIEVIAV